jgi:homoserine O-acetyltransferase
MQRVSHGRLYLIPARASTSGHGTTANARFYTQQLQEFLQSAPQRPAE